MGTVRRRYAAGILAVVSVTLCMAERGDAEPPAPSFEGQRIVNISFDPAKQPLEARDLYDILPLKRDQSYRSQVVRDAIERLYSTGRYQDIQVDVTTVNGGVAVRFLTKGSWFIGKVAVDSDLGEPPNPGQIVNASHLSLGQPFDADQLKPAVEQIRKLLSDNGYFRVAVEPRLDYDSSSQQVDITFAIQAADRAHYEQPEVSGDDEILGTKTIDNATKWQRFIVPGSRGITQNRTRGGIDNVRLKYEDANRLLATVVLNAIDYDKETNRGRPHLTIDPGPNVNITAVGAKLRRKHLKENVPVFEEHTVDPDLLTEGANNLRNYFQAQGYFDADVEFKQQQIRNDRSEIQYLVNPGARHRFVYLGIKGNKYFDLTTIRERMFLVPKSFEFRRGRYSEALRKRDEEAIANLYKSNGFRDVEVSSRIADDYKGKPGDLAVYFTIREGPQSFVASLRITGPKQLDLTKTIQSLSSQAGQIFSEFNVASDRETIIQYYYESGFPNATFEWQASPASRPNTVDLTFIITEGEQQFVRQVLISGLETTKPTLVHKQILLNPNDPLSPTKMTETQHKLYELGIFAAVDTTIQNPDGDERRKYVLYEMEEASRYTITGGFGAEFARIGGSNAPTDLSDPGGATGVNPRVSLDVSRLNVMGLGHTISLRSRYSTIQKRASLNYFAPRMWDNPNLDATFSILYDDTRDVRTFRAQRAEASVQLGQRITKPITVFYRFSYRNVDTSDLKIDPHLVPRYAQTVRVGMASFNLIQDRRDDPTDAHKGMLNTIDIGLAAKAFGSQTSFGRILGRNATYHRLGQRLILARETQMGVEPAYNIPPDADPTDPIPFPERFYGGGGNTHRGFPENQAGPRDLTTGFPLGGSALLFNNTELRFPLHGANINGVLFHDAGNVYSTLGKISFRVNQRDQSDFDYMVHAVGFGIRYRTPVGPVRVDLAYSINPPKYYGFSGTYPELVQCSANNTCVPSNHQISHFQFFFSIGQAF